MSEFELTIIVAVTSETPGPEAVISSVAASCTGRSVEVLLVGHATAPASRSTPMLAVRQIPCASNELVPVRWGRGIREASAPLVACLSSEFTVTPEWAPTLLAEMHAGVVGVAGAVALAPAVSAATAAMYLLRFAAFLPQPGTAATAANIPGDGACYRREEIVAFPGLLAEGFWEVEFHRRWKDLGLALRFDPKALVCYHGPATLRNGAMLRFRHGREYGSTMVLRNRHSPMRHILPAPVLPALLLGRIARRVASTRSGIGTFARALGPLLVLTAAWSAGEAAGALDALQGERGQ